MFCLDRHGQNGGGVYEPVGEGDYRFMEQLRAVLWQWERELVV
jgi:hypothetical protein